MTTLAILERVLRDAQYEVLSTQQPEEVVDLAAQGAVDVIVLDVMMPGLSGYDVLHRLRADRRTESVPILFLSGLREGVDRVRGLREGADDYIVKPVEPEELVLRLERLISPRPAYLAGLEGNLEVYSFAEVIQNLHAAKKSGLLALVSRSGSGWVALRAGSLLDATLGTLRRTDAVLAMVHLTHGHFRFEPGDPAERGFEAGTEIPLGNILLHAAWVSDELEHRRSLLPDPASPLELRNDVAHREVPEGFDRLPVGLIFERLASRPGTTRGELLAEGFSPSTTVDLALAWMFECGLVGSLAGSVPAGRRGVDDTGRRKILKSTVRRLLERAKARGHRIDSVHFLFQVCLDAWADLRGELAGSATPFASRELSQGSTFSLSDGNGELLIHLRELSPDSQRRVDAILRLSAGVAVWLGKDFDPDTVKVLVGDVEEGLQDRSGVLIAGGPESRRKAEELTRGTNRWRVAPESATTLDAILDLLL